LLLHPNSSLHHKHLQSLAIPQVKMGAVLTAFVAHPHQIDSKFTSFAAGV
jgi:ATP adenylyltransferase/5',5'''-P-1,P-4-tetraphosphate phosphorylase II